jgi:hypothetical protein
MRNAPASWLKNSAIVLPSLWNLFFSTPPLSQVGAAVFATLTPQRQPHGKKITANSMQAFYTKKIIKCPTLYLLLLSCLFQRTLNKVIPSRSVTIGIYVIIKPLPPVVPA